MTSPGRHDPCPCGSGRKYKQCCQTVDLAADDDTVRAAKLRAAAAGAWEVEAVPIPLVIREPGSERPVMSLVAARGVILHQEILGRLDGDASEVAEVLADAILETAKTVGFWPERVRIRHSPVRDALAPLVAGPGVEVELRDDLPHLTEVALGLMEHLGCPAWWPPVSGATSWLGWGLPDTLVAEIFEAAADFWEAAPWTSIENLQSPRCVLPSGRAWTVTVLGNGGEEYGLLLHSEHFDAFERPGLCCPDLAFEGVLGSIMSLLFGPLSEMPGRARKVITSRRWRVADARACPELMTVNTPGGGVSEEDARDLILLLRALPRFALSYGPALDHEIENWEPVDLRWTDEKTGVVFRYGGEAFAYGGPNDSPGCVINDSMHAEIREVIDELQQELETEIGDVDIDLFPARAKERLEERLERMGEPLGESLEPSGESLDHVDTEPREYFGGLSIAQMLSLLTDEWVVGDQGGGAGVRSSAPPPAVRLRDDLTPVELAGVPAHEGISVLLNLAEEEGGLDRTQAGNLKVAVVREWIARIKECVPEWAEIDKKVGARGWEVDVPHLRWLRVLAVLCGWLYPRSGRFELTSEGRRALEPEREGERYARLFKTCVHDFKLESNSFCEWPRGQRQVAFTLYRLGHVASEWTTTRALLDRRVVAPSAEQILFNGRLVDLDTLIVQLNLLMPLTYFGLLEHRWSRGATFHSYRVTPLYRRFLEFDV